MSFSNAIQKDLAFDFMQGRSQRLYPVSPGELMMMVGNQGSKTITLNGLGDIPEMAETTSEAAIAAIDEISLSATALPFHAAFEVNEDDLRNHVLGDMLSGKTQALGAEAAAWSITRLLKTRLSAFESTNCYDGQYLFDTDHPYDGGTQSNDLTYTVASTSKITESEAIGIFEAALAQMATFRTDTGRTIYNPTEAVIIASPSNGQTFNSLFSARNQMYRDGSGASNPFAGMGVKVLADPNIADTKIYVVNVSAGVARAFGWYEFVAPQLEIGITQKNPITGNYVIAVRCKGEVFPAEYRSAVLTTLSA